MDPLVTGRTRERAASGKTRGIRTCDPRTASSKCRSPARRPRLRMSGTTRPGTRGSLSSVSSKRRSSTRRRSGRDVRLPRLIPRRRVPFPPSSTPFPDALSRLAASLRTRSASAHRTGRAAARPAPAGRARNGKRRVSSTRPAPPERRAGNGPGSAQPTSRAECRWVLEERVRYDAHTGVVNAVSPVRAELGERCVVLLTLC
jgi:hypothetical protein